VAVLLASIGIHVIVGHGEKRRKNAPIDGRGAVACCGGYEGRARCGCCGESGKSAGYGGKVGSVPDVDVACGQTKSFDRLGRNRRHET